MVSKSLCIVAIIIVDVQCNGNTVINVVALAFLAAEGCLCQSLLPFVRRVKALNRIVHICWLSDVC